MSITISTSGRDLVSRWNRALDRAHAAGITATPVAGKTWYAVTSTDQSVVYMTDRDRCTCAAGQHGDPVCCHRALVREITAPQPPTPAAVTSVTTDAVVLLRAECYLALERHNAELAATGTVSRATQRAADAANARLDRIGYADRQVA